MCPMRYWLLLLCLPLIHSRLLHPAWLPKRDRETSYGAVAPAYGSYDEVEPSCEELRAIWRLSKRAVRHSMLTNEIPTHAGTFGYMVKTPPNIYTPPPRPKHRQAFGKIIVDPATKHTRVASYGGPTSFDTVAEVLRQEGAFADRPFRHVGKMPQPDSTTHRPKGFGSFHKHKDPTTAQSTYPEPYMYGRKTEPPRLPVALYSPPPTPANLDSTLRGFGKWGNGFQEAPSSRLTSKPLVPAYGSFETVPTGFAANTKACSDVKYKSCLSNEDCSCYGFYSCVKGKCRNKSSPGTATSGWDSNSWHEGPLRSSELGVTVPRKSKEGRRRKTFRKPDRKKLLPDYSDYAGRFGPWS